MGHISQVGGKAEGMGQDESRPVREGAREIITVVPAQTDGPVEASSNGGREEKVRAIRSRIDTTTIPPPILRSSVKSVIAEVFSSPGKALGEAPQLDLGSVSRITGFLQDYQSRLFVAVLARQSKVCTLMRVVDGHYGAQQRSLASASAALSGAAGSLAALDHLATSLAALTDRVAITLARTQQLHALLLEEEGEGGDVFPAF